MGVIVALIFAGICYLVATILAIVLAYRKGFISGFRMCEKIDNEFWDKQISILKGECKDE